MKVQKLTQKEMEREIKESANGKTVVIDFYADWCGPCKMLAPIYEELSDEMSDVFFGKVNVEEERGAVSAYSVMSVPTVLVFKNGKKMAKSHGLVAKEQLRQTIHSVSLY